MKRLFWAVLAAASCNPASAFPVSQYDLIVDSCVVRPTNPYAPPGSACNAATINALEGTALVLSSSPAAFEYIQHSGGFTVSDVGFEEIVVPEPSRSVPPLTLYPPTGLVLCAADCDLKVTASTNGASLLDAVLDLRTGIDDLFFSGGGGYLASDFPTFGGDFTGHFELVSTRDIAEPATLCLVLIAGLGLVVLRGAPRTQGRFSEG